MSNIEEVLKNGLTDSDKYASIIRELLAKIDNYKTFDDVNFVDGVESVEDDLIYLLKSNGLPCE